MKYRQQKQYAFKLNELTEDGVFEGVVTKYGELDVSGDVLLKGALKESIQRTSGKVPVLRNHSAKIEDIAGVGLSITEAGDEVIVKGKLDLDRDAGNDTYKAVKFAFENNGSIGLSVGITFNTIDIVYKDGVRYLSNVDMFEYSFVVFPAVESAKLTSIKSVIENGDEKERATSKKHLESVLRGAGCTKKQALSAVSAVFKCRDDVEDATYIGGVLEILKEKK